MAYVQTSGGGRSWKRVVDPGTGVFASKTSGWSGDSFSGGLEVDFSSVVPAGSVAVEIFMYQSGTRGSIYTRPSGDTNISNTPGASGEWSTQLMFSPDQGWHGIVWLSSDYKIQIAVSNTATDIQVSHPTAVLI